MSIKRQKRAESSPRNSRFESRSYSFGKSDRKIIQIEAPITSKIAPLQVESAEQTLCKRTITAIIVPKGTSKNRLLNAKTTSISRNHPSKQPMCIQECLTAAPALDSNPEGQILGQFSTDDGHSRGESIDTQTNSGTTDSERSSVSLDYLSHRPRTPSITLYHKPHKPRKNAATVANSAVPTPGPGVYAVGAVSDISSILKEKKGIIYREKKPLTATERAARIARASALAVIPGPGDYDIEQAEKTLLPSQPIVVMHRAESKPTPHSLRKAYWEEKSRLAREEHDDLRDPNDSLLRSKSPTVTIRADTKAGISWKNRQIMRERAAEEDRRLQLAYNVEYSQVETAPHVAVNMAQEVAVEKSMHERILQKPGLAEVYADKEREKLLRDRFLGPNLQIPWVMGKTGKNGDQKKDPNAIDDGDESPTEEVMELLRRRAARPRDAEDNNELFDDTTAAYLRSSLTGAPFTRPAPVVMKPPGPNDKRNPDIANVSVEYINRDYLEPQLQTDWKVASESRSQRHKSPAMRLDIRPGREQISIKRKGEIYRKEFQDSVVATDDMGPGVYDVLAGRSFGEGVTAPKFDSILARDEAIGPNGERPVRSIKDEMEINLELGEELDVDPRITKDSELVKQSRVMYSKISSAPRYPKEKPKEGAELELGGNWFQGMSEEILKKTDDGSSWIKRPLVDYRHMKGREDDDGGDSSIEGDQEELDIQVENWKPHLKSDANQMAWATPKEQPRFKKESKPVLLATAPELSPKYSFRDARPLVTVNYDQQRGRDDAVEEDQLMYEIEGMDGGGDEGIAVSLEAEEEEGRKKGWEASSSNRRIPAAVNMRLQTKRKDLARKSAAPDVVYDVKLHLMESRAGKGGVVEWAKEEDLVSGDEGDEGMAEFATEELNLSPQTSSQSKYKRAVDGPAWSRGDDLDRIYEPKPSEGADLEYDIDSGLAMAKPGSALKWSVRMNKQQTYRDRDVEHEAIYSRKLGLKELQDERLDINPVGAKDNLRKKMDYGVEWKKEDTDRFSIPENGEDGDVLQLSPKKFEKEPRRTVNMGKERDDSYEVSGMANIRELEGARDGDVLELDNQPKAHGIKLGVKFDKYSSRELVEVEGKRDSDVEGDVLQLSPKKSKPNQRSISMSRGSEKIDVPKDADESEELILSPPDPSKRRGSGQSATAWDRQQSGRRGVDAKESKDIMAEIGVLTEVLDIYPEKPLKRPPGKAVKNWDLERNLNRFRGDGESTVVVEKEAGYTREVLELNPSDSSQRRSIATTIKQSAQRIKDENESMIVEEITGMVRVSLDINPEKASRMGARSVRSWDKESDTVGGRQLKNESLIMKEITGLVRETLDINPVQPQQVSQRAREGWNVDNVDIGLDAPGKSKKFVRFEDPGNSSSSKAGKEGGPKASTNQKKSSKPNSSLGNPGPEKNDPGSRKEGTQKRLDSTNRKTQPRDGVPAKSHSVSKAQSATAHSWTEELTPPPGRIPSPRGLPPNIEI